MREYSHRSERILTRDGRTLSSVLRWLVEDRVLAIAAALYSVEEGSTVAIEEVDNGGHPSRVASLLERITDTARQRGLRILLTTHNATTLDSISDALIPTVTVCYRNPHTGAIELQRLEDFHFYPELAAQGHLCHVVSRGLLERSIRSAETDHERRARALTWLDDFFGDGRDAR